MILKQLLAAYIVFAGLTASANADNCDFNRLDFGINQEKLKSEFKLNTMDASTEGEGVINVGANEVCKDLPPSASVEFRLIDNNFVQLTIKNENKSGEILAFANKVFGEKDNADKANENSISLWNKENQYSVIYNTHKTGRHNIESLVITSAKHKDLFDKQNKKDDVDASNDDKKAKAK
jgi:hypothetical protein